MSRASTRKRSSSHPRAGESRAPLYAANPGANPVLLEALAPSKAGGGVLEPRKQRASPEHVTKPVHRSAEETSKPSGERPKAPRGTSEGGGVLRASRSDFLLARTNRGRIRVERASAPLHSPRLRLTKSQKINTGGALRFAAAEILILNTTQTPPAVIYLRRALRGFPGRGGRRGKSARLCEKKKKKRHHNPRLIPTLPATRGPLKDRRDLSGLIRKSHAVSKQKPLA